MSLFFPKVSMRKASRDRSPYVRPTLRPAVYVLHLAVLFVSISCCSGDYDDIVNLDSTGTVIVCFGDSITAGYGVGRNQTFPALLAESLEMTVVNAGVDGDTTADALARLDRDVMAHDPRLVLVQFGGNDFRKKMDKRETFANLERIVERIGGYGAIIILLELRIGLLRDEYLAGYRDIAKAHGALLIPNFMSDILGNHNLTIDGIHPNAEGHELIAERVAKKLAPLLAEAERARAGKRQAP